VAKSQKKRSTRKRSTARSRKAASAASRPGKKSARKRESRKPGDAVTPAECDQPTREDQAAYLETVIATGEAARLDRNGKLPAGATHKIVEDDSGNVKVVRRRFSIS
jgi:hypothetical protein